MNIVIVEDDVKIASFLAKGLKAEGYATMIISDGDEAMTSVPAMGNDVDLVLLDLSLPGKDGKAVLTSWRANKFTRPVIILTARDDISDKIRGLDSGANDYVTKPFSFAELLARIRAVLRGLDQTSATVLQVLDLDLDLVTKLAWRGGQRIDLAPKEWALLELFMRNPNQILSRMQILNHVWDYSFDPGSNIVDVYVGYLRKKINLPGKTELLLTIRGAGYRFLPSQYQSAPASSS
ncbi:MAG: response regulator transcription factor [Acidimicrobiaceae bacterium]|nr:response regulator transcription factor [Acidimicrobiaceae bacterium]